MNSTEEPCGETPSDSSERLQFNIPNAFCAIRLVGSFVMVSVVLTGTPAVFLGLFLVLAFTDWIDGKLAIWLNQRTTFGARLDSLADAAMYGALLFGSVWYRSDVLAAESPWIATALGCYAVSCVTALIKFRRLPSHHTYSAKIAWLLTVMAALSLFGGWSNWPLRVAMIAVSIANLESAIITLRSNRWQADVPTVGGL